jgi:callose synthase
VLVVQLGFQLTFLSFIQLDDRALNTVMNKLFKNYKSWCKFLGRKHSLWYEA